MDKIVLLYNDYFEIYNRTETSPGELAEVFNAVEHVKESLENLGYNVVPVSIVQLNLQLLDFLDNNRDALIFNLCESIDGDPEKEKILPQFLENRGILFTGSGPKALELCLNKFQIKKVLQKHSIPTPNATIFKNSCKSIHFKDLRFPLIIKPSHEDASIGISSASVVYNITEAIPRIRYIIDELKQPAIAEEYIEGREITVSIWGNSPPTIIESSEIDFRNMPKELPKIVTYKSKWDSNSAEFHGTKPICPAIIHPSLKKSIDSIALNAFSLSGCKDYGRVDFRISFDDKPFVIDINPNPDLSPEAGFFRAVASKGLDYTTMVSNIIHFSKKRDLESLQKSDQNLFKRKIRDISLAFNYNF